MSYATMTKKLENNSIDENAKIAEEVIIESQENKINAQRHFLESNEQNIDAMINSEIDNDNDNNNSTDNNNVDEFISKKVDGEQISFMESIRQNMNVINDSESYDSDDEYSSINDNNISSAINLPNNNDPEFEKRKRKAMINAKPYEAILKKRLIENEASRLTLCCQNKDNNINDITSDNNDDNNLLQDYLFMHLPLEDGGIRTCGVCVKSNGLFKSISLNDYLKDNNLCEYCMEILDTDIDNTNISELGINENRLHKTCRHLLSINALHYYVDLKNYSDFISIGKICNNNQYIMKCDLCDKRGGILQIFSLQSGARSNLSPPNLMSSHINSQEVINEGENISHSSDEVRVWIGHPICITSLINSKQLEPKYIVTSKSTDTNMISNHSRDDSIINYFSVFDKNMNSGVCTICGSQKGLVFTCGSPFCAVQAHNLCAKMESWYLGEANNISDMNKEENSTVFLCPLHSTSNNTSSFDV
jgi:hypothetical protein